MLNKANNEGIMSNMTLELNAFPSWSCLETSRSPQTESANLRLHAREGNCPRVNWQRLGKYFAEDSGGGGDHLRGYLLLAVNCLSKKGAMSNRKGKKGGPDQYKKKKGPQTRIKDPPANAKLAPVSKPSPDQVPKVSNFMLFNATHCSIGPSPSTIIW